MGVARLMLSRCTYTYTHSLNQELTNMQLHFVQYQKVVRFDIQPFTSVVISIILLGKESDFEQRCLCRCTQGEELSRNDPGSPEFSGEERLLSSGPTKMCL